MDTVAKCDHYMLIPEDLAPRIAPGAFIEVTKQDDVMGDSDMFCDQGWAATLANLENSVTALEKRFSRLKDTYSAYLHKREHYREVIDEDLHVLIKIPVLLALLDPR